ncbi:laccase C [Multifurca ochricompacta]|uniref:laccase n=1 Tax=Multifurca ochricompacta TaxID=376703 RepID=A0AAD4LZK5_9AGAM|nr:laccase C [Multifurca ochricompacta]
MNRLLSLLLLLAATSGRVSAAIGPSADLEIVNLNIAPDGFNRSTVLAGGTFPGPLIQGNKNDDFAINVIDSLTDTSMNVATSIHWHGLFQKGTNYADGPAFVTQCPIVPDNSFLYKFQALEQAGTYWYHSHFQNQYCDGLRGALVVYDPDDPHAALYDVDDESTVITLADWYHYLSTNAPAVPDFSATLINGVGRYSGGPTEDLAVVNVTAGKRYRFRLVSISCDPNFTFSIDGHDMTIIEVDGNNVEPLVVDSIQIFAGQRYSFVLNANQTVDNYWIRALPPRQDYTGLINLAVLHYDGADNANPTTDPTTDIPTSSSPLVETNLHPLEPTGVPGDATPGGADININLALALNNGQFTVNGVAFEPPSVPVLLQILSGTQNASDLLPSGSIYGLEANKSVELTIPALIVAGPHPIHLHGHSFHVVRSAGNTSYNFDNPVVRDVVSIGTGSTDIVTIRFFTDNPGPWFLHCHIDWHLNAGLAVVFAEDVPDVPAQDITSSAWENLCPTYNAFVNSTGNT